MCYTIIDLPSAKAAQVTGELLAKQQGDAVTQFRWNALTTN